MKAVVYTEYGSADVLRIEQIPEPIPNDEEILIRVRAVEVTKSVHKYDVIFDMVARSSYSGCVNALAPGGRYLMGNPRLSDMIRSVLTSVLTDKNVFFAFAGETEEELLALKEMIEAGKLKSTVDRVYPIDRIAEAHRRVETEERLGSVVVSW